jgi:hypothetical protein
MDEHGDDGDIPLQRRGSFEPYKIKGIIEAPLAGLILRLGPLSPYDRQEDSTSGNTLVNRFAKIAPGLDGSDIHKHRVFAEVASEIVEQATRFAFRVISAITEEDCPHCNRVSARRTNTAAECFRFLVWGQAGFELWSTPRRTIRWVCELAPV